MERSYYIAEEHDLRRVVDEAILTLLGVIEEISRRHKRYRGKHIEMQFVCARSFERDHAGPAVDKPFLMSVGLRGEVPSIGAYLPADAFWALGAMTASGAVTHIVVDFGPSRYGYADLLGINFRAETPPSGFRAAA